MAELRQDPEGWRRWGPYQTETRDVTAAEEAQVRVELRRGEGIGIVARDGIFGTPLRGLIARVVDGAGTAVFNGGLSLDSEGRGEIPSLRPGQYELRVGAGEARRPARRAPSIPSCGARWSGSWRAAVASSSPRTASSTWCPGRPW